MSRQQNNAAFGLAAIVITVIAGAWTLFHLIWNTTNHTADDYWGQALLVLFVVGVILAFAQYFSERSALKATISPNEQFPEPTIARFFFGSAGSAPMWFVVRMNVGAQWFLAGWEKIKEPAVWGTSGVAIKGFVQGALAKSNGPFPSVQGWYANFLQHFVLPNAGLFSFLVTYGELAVGLGILLGALTGIAAGFGVLMNLNYLLSGTVSINPVIGMFGLFLVFSWRVCGWIGLDRFLLPALGLPWRAGTLFQARQPSNPSPPAATAS
jgi:thiosulfate dehydrogenase (quinone) large subunit